MDLLSKLNENQQQAVLTSEGPLLLLAGAGSGKTRVLTHRIAYLIQNGVYPNNILALTFTNKAAKEMKERVESLIPNGDRVWVGTFHSTCVRILRAEIENLNYDTNFTIFDDDDCQKLLRLCLKELNISEKQFPLRTISALISDWKDRILSPRDVLTGLELDFRKRQVALIYELYQKKLRENNSLDFDDIICCTVSLYRAYPNILEKYQDRFKYILVDEYQDTNSAQYELVRLLSSKYKNLCVVGDDDQSIYGWRGANIANILNFEKDFPGTKVIKLEQNYRSTQTILNAANGVIANNSQRKVKSLWTENTQGNLIYYNRMYSDQDESQFVAQTIQQLVKDRPYSDIAVLYRNNAQSRIIEDQFVYKNIPYKLYGGVRFYQRKEVKDVLSYLKVIHNPNDTVSLFRIINVPKRGIGETTVDRINNFAAESGLSFFKALWHLDSVEGLGNRAKKVLEFRELISNLIDFSKEHSALEVIHKVLEDTDLLNNLQADNDLDEQNRRENVEELVSKLAEYDSKANDPSLSAFLEEVALVADVDNYEETENAVVMMTLHSSKGLEFPVVFMVGLEEGLFPSYRSICSGLPEDVEEERRLCYVGMTRAKEQLYITSCTQRLQHGQTVYNSQSRFISEIPTDLLDNQTRQAKPVQKDRKGISQFAKNDKARSNIEISFGGKNYNTNIPGPKDLVLDFEIGDKVRQFKYGIGIVRDIKPAGADFEVSVEFEGLPAKKFLANLSKLAKVED